MCVFLFGSTAAQLDIIAYSTCLFWVSVDEIYHLASPASPPNYMYNPIKTIKTNTLGTINMLGTYVSSTWIKLIRLLLRVRTVCKLRTYHSRPCRWQCVKRNYYLSTRETLINKLADRMTSRNQCRCINVVCRTCVDRFGQARTRPRSASVNVRGLRRSGLLLNLIILAVIISFLIHHSC